MKDNFNSKKDITKKRYTKKNYYFIINIQNSNKLISLNVILELLRFYITILHLKIHPHKF